jgi:mono/diheme cytochrome c family protein
MKLKIFAAVTLTLGISFAALATDTSKLPPASDKKDATYATDIKPIFEASCTKCHGAEKAKAKLRLDSLEAALKGGEDGKCITPGNSAKSDLVLSVAHIGDPDAFMPSGKNAKQLSPEQIGLIRAWIDQGAK